MAHTESLGGEYRVIPDVIIKRTGRFDYLGNSSASHGAGEEPIGQELTPFSMDNLPGGTFKVEDGHITELAPISKTIAKKGRIFTRK